MLRVSLLVVPILLLLPALVSAQLTTTGPSRALDSTDVLVLLDNNPVHEAQEYVLQRDLPYALKVQRLKPNSAIEVKVKFAGGVGVKRQEATADRSGNFHWVFDTPERRSSAEAIVTYTTANGQQRTRSFRIRVE
jgi:hypothetical protein